MKTIYLSGPIKGCTDEECRGWRDQVKCELAGMYEFIDPMSRDFRGKEETVTSYLVVAPDLNEISRSDIVICNFGKLSIGTAQEQVYADLFRKKVIVFGQYRNHPWVRYHRKLSFDTISGVIRYLKG
jgi:hypothetical protein